MYAVLGMTELLRTSSREELKFNLNDELVNPNSLDSLEGKAITFFV